MFLYSVTLYSPSCLLSPARNRPHQPIQEHMPDLRVRPPRRSLPHDDMQADHVGKSTVEPLCGIKTGDRQGP